MNTGVIESSVNSQIYRLGESMLFITHYGAALKTFMSKETTSCLFDIQRPLQTNSGLLCRYSYMFLGSSRNRPKHEKNL